MFDQLPCSAKLLHLVLFQFNDPHSQVTIQQFEKECEFLSEIWYPHVVQYLGVARDTELDLLALLMDCWMNPSLIFSSNWMSPSPTILRSIGAMAYPWSLPISTWMTSSIGTSQATVLLIAGNRAKVADFGMSKLSELHPYITPLTQCPGTVVYMPPEALLNPVVYSGKLDIFSTGFICSCSDHDPKFPWPRPSNKCLWRPQY